MKKLLKCCADALSISLFFIGVLAFLALIYTNHVWGNVYFEQLAVAALNDYDTVGSYIVTKYICFVFLPACVLTLFCVWKINSDLRLCMAAFLLLGYSLKSLKIIEYWQNQSVYSEIYEAEYVNPKDINFEFPTEKRNLIVLYLESMEQDYADSSLVGKNLIPHLSSYMQKELSFPNFYQMPSQDYTMAAIVSSMCGVPYRIDKGVNPYLVKNFLPHLKCYPQILQRNGYENYMLKSTDLNFAGARRFYSLHGFKHLKDKNNIQKEINLEQHQGTSWGYNDRTYYRLAKKELSKIAAKGKPFMFVMITLDTHGPDIYLDKQCEKRFNDQRDVVECADAMAAEFITWLQNQEFYENTVVLVMGDHPETGKNKLYPQHKNRKIVQFILNPAKNVKAKPHEIWSTIDLAPTVLDALGIKFEANGFGLGRSLLREEPTLYEKYRDRLSNELLKGSHFYDTFYHKNRQ